MWMECKWGKNRGVLSGHHKVGTLKRAELSDVNTNTAAQSIDTERASVNSLQRAQIC